MFKHPREAQAILQEQVTYHMMKGGIRMGIKLGLVVTLYVTACQVYIHHEVLTNGHNLINILIIACIPSNIFYRPHIQLEII